MDIQAQHDLLEQIESKLVSGETNDAASLLTCLESEALSPTLAAGCETKRIRLLWTLGEYEAANRSLTAFAKKQRLKVGSREWTEHHVLRAFMNQSLGHTSKAKKDLDKIIATIDPHSEVYPEILFNLAAMLRDIGDCRTAEQQYLDILSLKSVSPDIKCKSALAIAKMRSDMDQGGIREYTERVRADAPRWGGWAALKIAEILEALDDFRMGMCGTGIRNLHRHVREADEADFTVPKLRARLALAESLIEVGDYRSAKTYLDDVGAICTSIQHSGLKYLQSTAELLWFQADLRANTPIETDRLLEALDRLEIILAVVAKYPRPPGPAPFWLTIGWVQQNLGQNEQALRSLRKARIEAESVGSYRIAASAGCTAAALEWATLSAEDHRIGANRNRILAETTQAMDGIVSYQRPELEWRIHYVRGKIFMDSGEPYPSREELKTAAHIVSGLIVSLDDPTLQMLYRKAESRRDALIELQEFMNVQDVTDDRQASTDWQAIPQNPAAAEQEHEINRLQNLLDALYMIHSSTALQDLFERILSACLQVLEADRCQVQVKKQLVPDGDRWSACGSRDRSNASEVFDIPARWIRETSTSKGVFSYIWNADETNPDTRHVMMTALKKADQVFGVIYVDRVKRAAAFTIEDESIFSTLASVATIALSSLVIRTRIQDLSEQLRREIVPQFKHIIGESAVMKDVFIQMQRVAGADLPVLIIGDTGTGKDLIARTIHEISPRAHHPFVYLDCSAIPMTLLESELFGIADGIATGVESRVGLLEYADGGTILMDEVGDVPLNTQAKLLRVLQEREFEPVGSDRVVSINVRVIATTSRDLQKLIEEGKMREDFFYRISGVVLQIPPLNRRPGDVLLLARTFLQKYNREFNKTIIGFAPELLDAMTAYNWPGNIRELDHQMRKAVLFCQHDRLALQDMNLPIAKVKPVALNDALDQMEIAAITDTIALCSGDIERAAHALRVPVDMVKKRLNLL
ncbi:sigma 54-interacting transcriptional regulator [bacterium]|nr:sigma 54-interacting transcriptional regulator [candidate division CSSED10-310 bacterium]